MEVTVSFFSLEMCCPFLLWSFPCFSKFSFFKGYYMKLLDCMEKSVFPRKQASLTKNWYDLSRSWSSKLQSYKGIHFIRAQTWKEISRLKVGTFLLHILLCMSAKTVFISGFFACHKINFFLWLRGKFYFEMTGIISW